MKIQIITNSPTLIDKYIIKLFGLLEEDKNFEKLVIETKKQLNIETPLLEKKIEPFIVRKYKNPELYWDYPKSSESTKNIKDNRYLDNPKIKHGYNIFDESLSKIIEEYPYIAEWKEELSDFLITNELVINENEPIKLKIKMKRRSFFGRYTDGGEDGVRILLTSKITAKQLNKWFVENKEQIDSFIKMMKSKIGRAHV